MKTTRNLALAASLSLALGAFSAGAAQPYRAEVTKVDAGTGKVTLKHGAIPKLDMDAMTMGYRVADPSMLKGLKAGDRVTFDAKGTDGDYTVTKIEKLK